MLQHVAAWKGQSGGGGEEGQAQFVTFYLISTRRLFSNSSSHSPSCILAPLLTVDQLTLKVRRGHDD